MIQDPFLATLIQMLQIEEMTARIFVTPGSRAYKGNASDLDKSQQVNIYVKSQQANIYVKKYMVNV